jgi:asparagine synthase (glutamine-hydrolysing)
MCGIVGLVAFEASKEGSVALVSAMAERMAHRGPDGGGVTWHPDATLGMKRLAIVDVEHGQQPMLNEDESIALVYNGEIYNAPALRGELEKQGVRFRTRSDTEVILRLYERDPEHVEEHLAGMWAFAIHDRRRRELVLSRDRFGIKPLFVVDTGTALAFASELRCFDRSLAPFAKRFELDPVSAHAMVSWSYVPEDATIYKGVRRLPPATRLVCDLGSNGRVKETYYRVRPSREAAAIHTLDDACVEVDRLLRRAVHEHLESDVPIATFLSGGIDSSLITAYAVEESTRPVRAFTIGFRETRFDESPFARETAEKIGVPIHVERFDEEKAKDNLADAMLAYDEPFGDSSSLAVYLLSSVVGKSYKVALGGDGGDEVFAGYTKYRINLLRKPFVYAPELRDGLARALSLLPSRMDRTSRWSEVMRQVGRISRGLAGADDVVYTQLTQFAALSRTAPLMQTPGGAEMFERMAQDRFLAAEGSALQRSLAADLGNPLPNDMLTKVDRASMACHLEARVPFLDHRLVELGLGLDQRFTLAFSGKRVLKTLHERRFGRKLSRRKKMGFGVPVEKWLRTSFDGACERLFSAPRLERFGLLSPSALGHGRFREWRAQDPLILWYAFALACWCEANLGDGPDALRELLHANKS